MEEARWPHDLVCKAAKAEAKRNAGVGRRHSPFDTTLLMYCYFRLEVTALCSIMLAATHSFFCFVCLFLCCSSLMSNKRVTASCQRD